MQDDSQRYIDPVVEYYKKDVDRTLIQENLLLTVQQRIEKLMELQKFAEELRSSRQQTTPDDNKLR